MKHQKHRLLGKLTAMILGAAMLAPGMSAAQESTDQEGTEVLTRGPVHEAFAGTVSFNPEVGIIVDQAPPALIEEVPPEQRLEGDNVAWIPGYWAWDEDQSDFLWISGIWRNLPPGRQWVPGYWAPIEGRHQWTSGYWEDAETTEVTYLPEPPKSVEAGPNIEASSNDQSWVPGNWIYRENRYAWRTGYWAPARANWSWTPAYYRWTHRGYVYVDGYWDYPVVSRGVVFAPVRFDVAYRSRPNFYYTPAAVISLAVFSNHLFLRPNYGHYYYGDYYEPRYRDRGFYASFSYSSSRYGYDPIYAHYRWENRNDRNWERGRRDYYEYRRDHQDARPPRNWATMNARRDGDRNRDDFEVAQRFDRVTSNREGGRQRFQAVSKQDRERYVSQRQEVRKYGKEREQLETRGDRVPATGGKDRASVTKEKINRSPVMAKKSDRSEKDGGAPERLQARASERDQKSEKSEQAGNNQRPNAGDSSNAKRNNDGKMDRESAPGSRDKGKAEPNAETRMKPGEKREKQPNTQAKEKREANPNPQQKDKATPGEKRQANPTPERQANPTPKRQADPAQERRTNPGEKRQANPTPERQANPTPKRQADPTPQRKANPTPKREGQPKPENKAKKPEEAASPARKAERQTVAQPKQQQPQRQQAARVQPQQKSQQAAAQAKPAKQQAQRQQASRPQPQQKSQQSAQTQRSAPKQQTRNAAAKNEATEAEKKKKKQAE